MGKVRCWELLKCNKKECPAYESKDLRCWLFSGTHCRDEIQGKFLEKMEMCLGCEVFQVNIDVPTMRETCVTLKKQFNQYRDIVGDRDREMENVCIDLSIGLSEVFEALKKIASGDPSVRIDETSGVELIGKLKHMVNLTAENIGEIVDQSHEFAIGLAEHFDVLHRVSRGDLNARVKGSSWEKLLESLKNVTNQMIENISRTMTEKKEFEKKLIHASDEWKATFDSMPYGVMLTDTEFNIIRTNTYISTLTNIPIKDLIGRKCYEIIHCTDKQSERCPLIKSTKTLSTEIMELYETSMNKYFMVYVTPILDEEGSIKAYVHSMADITEMKEKEKQVIESRDSFFNMLKDVDFSFRELKELYEGLILSFVNTIDAKSTWTKGHSERVAHYSTSIAQEMGISETDIKRLRIAALLHDVGKIGTYDVILNKPERLTDEEYALVRLHPVKGEEILRPIRQLQDILPIIRSHHERLDGNGYPDRLKGEEIPLLARIITAADSFDSMTSHRPYRPSPGKEYAILELKKFSGIQFDPRVVEAFLSVLKTE
jgi:putative nucleotidyltransferase with HDIG domain/PAS domain S-box-containing protein